MAPTAKNRALTNRMLGNHDHEERLGVRQEPERLELIVVHPWHERPHPRPQRNREIHEQHHEEGPHEPTAQIPGAGHPGREQQLV